MDRDSKGRFKKRNEDEEDCTEVWNKAPSLKLLVLLLLIVWLFLGWFPTPSELKTHACSYCPSPPNQTQPITDRECPTPFNPKTTDWKPKI